MLKEKTRIVDQRLVNPWVLGLTKKLDDYIKKHLEKRLMVTLAKVNTNAKQLFTDPSKNVAKESVFGKLPPDKPWS